MKQFLINRTCRPGLSLSFRGKDFHYLCHVRRHKLHQKLPVRDAGGISYTAVITDIAVDSCTIRIEDSKEEDFRDYSLELYCCLPKGKKLDTVIRQATEAGVKRIIPVFSDHSLIRYQRDGDIDKKVLRWSKIIREARQQSGSGVSTELSPPLEMEHLPPIGTREAGFYCHQEFIRPNSLSDLFHKTPELIRILIGPEGGLSDKEIRSMEEKSYSPLFLGSPVLRTETACLFAISSIITVMELL